MTNSKEWIKYMTYNYYRQTSVTQIPLPFAGYNKISSLEETSPAMSLEKRIRTVIDELPGPTRGKQVRLAEIADVSKQMVNHWLSGVTTTINYEPARRICDQLGYRMDWLMRGKGPVRKDDKDEAIANAEQMALVYLTAKEQQIITNYRSSDEMGQAIIEAAAARSKKD